MSAVARSQPLDAISESLTLNPQGTNKVPEELERIGTNVISPSRKESIRSEAREIPS